MQRRGRTIRESLLDLKLAANDTLLLLGHEDTIVHIMNSPNVVVTDGQRLRSQLNFICVMWVKGEPSATTSAGAAFAR